jgi:hypothetical protein
MLDYGGSLLMDILIFQNESDSAQAVSHAMPISPDLGYGRLDVYQALTAWRRLVGVL